MFMKNAIYDRRGIDGQAGELRIWAVTMYGDRPLQKMQLFS